MTNSSWPLMNNNISRADLDKVIEYLKQDDPKLTHGPLVMNFEEKWSEWLGVRYSVMLNSGASANDLTMMALKEIKGAGEVIVPPLTWVSDISSVIRAGLKPIFVDINPNSLAMDTDLILSALTPQTKAVFLTHILGYNGLTNKLIDELKNLEIVCIKSDEIILSFDNWSDITDLVKSVDEISYLKWKLFTVERVSDFRINSFFDKFGVFTHKELSGCNGHKYFIYLKKYILNEPLDIRDLYFRMDGDLAIWNIDGLKLEL
jgi:hypothetical protein